MKTSSKRVIDAAEGSSVPEQTMVAFRPNSKFSNKWNPD
jgi:hypothetical protein